MYGSEKVNHANPCAAKTVYKRFQANVGLTKIPLKFVH